MADKEFSAVIFCMPTPSLLSVLETPAMKSVICEIDTDITRHLLPACLQGRNHFTKIHKTWASTISDFLDSVYGHVHIVEVTFHA